MLPTTRDAIRALLKADPSLTPTDRQAIVAAASGHGRKAIDAAVGGGPRLLRPRDAAKMLAVTTRSLSNYAAAGMLSPVKLPGRQRAAGYRYADVVALIEGRGGEP